MLHRSVIRGMDGIGYLKLGVGIEHLANNYQQSQSLEISWAIPFLQQRINILSEIKTSNFVHLHSIPCKFQSLQEKQYKGQCSGSNIFYSGHIFTRPSFFSSDWPDSL